jgi:hypothetical protein
VVNRVAFLVFGLIPGEVVLQGTFAPVEVEAETAAEAAAARDAARVQDGVGATKSAKKKTKAEKKRARDGAYAVARDAENEKYAGDGMTVRARFESPRITLGGLPSFSVGPKSSVVLSTTYLDEDVRLGKGSRGSLFVFARKSAAQAERDRARWKVGGFGVSVMLACTAALVFFAVQALPSGRGHRARGRHRRGGARVGGGGAGDAPGRHRRRGRRLRGEVPGAGGARARARGASQEPGAMNAGVSVTRRGQSRPPVTNGVSLWQKVGSRRAPSGSTIDGRSLERKRRLNEG